MARKRTVRNDRTEAVIREAKFLQKRTGSDNRSAAAHLLAVEQDHDRVRLATGNLHHRSFFKDMHIGPERRKKGTHDFSRIDEN